MRLTGQHVSDWKSCLFIFYWFTVLLFKFEHTFRRCWCTYVQCVQCVLIQGRKHTECSGPTLNENLGQSQTTFTVWFILVVDQICHIRMWMLARFIKRASIQVDFALRQIKWITFKAELNSLPYHKNQWTMWTFMSLLIHNLSRCWQMFYDNFLKLDFNSTSRLQ